MSENPFQSPRATGPAPGMSHAMGGQIPVGAIMPLVNAKGWLKLMGIVQIIIGGMYCLTIIGAVIGWLPIWMGILLTKASAALENPNNPDAVHEAMSKLGTLFTIAGVLTLIWLGMIVLYIVFFIVMIVVGVGAGAMSGASG